MASGPAARGRSIAAFIPELENLISEVAEEWQVPGLAVAVVLNGETAFAKPYGQRDVEAGLAVTTDTQFQLMSVSKSFAATGLALLVDERRLDWKKPVREYLPEFQLHDAVASDRVTVRDLLCHHTGLPRDLTPAQMLAAMRHLEPSADLRSTFQYSNLGYLAASMVAERVSGRSWAEFTRALTDKLRMAVTFTVAELATAADAAMPSAVDGDTRRRATLWPVSVAAAGGMSTSIAGFANWLRLHLGKGEFAGQRLLSPGLIAELQAPRVHVGPTEFACYSDVHYGLGFRSHWYRGERVVWHGGGFTGTNALMMMLPDRGVGVAVLANLGMTPLFAPHILANYVFDRVCGKEPAPWLDRFREQRRKFVAQQDADREVGNASRRPATQPSRDLSVYAGDYEHPGYGRITITRAEGHLHWAFRGMSDPLTHRRDDAFELPREARSPGGLLPPRLPLTFSADHDGKIVSLAVPLEPMVKAIAFTRVAAGDGTPLGDDNIRM
jgi:CubicO group peptidase (beta-lactamase class C family)